MCIALASCQHEPEIFRVSFVLDGQPYTYQDIVSGQKATVPAQPSHMGYVVIWCSDEAKEVEYDFDTPVIQALTLYGKWVASKAEIPLPQHYVYDGNEHRGIAESEMYDCRGTVAATDVGYYKATASLRKGYAWTDGTTDDITVAWTIARRPVSVTGESGTVSYDGNSHSLTSLRVEGLLSKHTLSGVTYKAEGTDYGTYRGEFSGNPVVKSGQKDVTSNFDILLTPGSLKVIEAENENSWTEIPSIPNWIYGGEEGQPSGASRYGTVSYSYSATEDFEVVTGKPTTAGIWYMKATVEATEAYGSLEKIVIFSISQADLSVSGIKADDKVYDGTTEVELDLTGIVVDGLIPGDSLEYSASGTFEDADIGEKTVTISGFAISGDKAPNYNVDSVQESTKANILARELQISSISAVDRVYDGTTDVALSGGILTNVVGEDEVFLNNSGVSSSMATADVGQDKAVTVTGFILTGKDKGNYSLTQPQGLTVNITKAPSAITKIPQSANVNYDGEQHPMAVAGECTGGTMKYSTDGETWVPDIPVMTNPGIYTLGYKVEGDSNHNDSSPAELTSKINPLVTFNANGYGTPPSPVHVAYNSAVARPADPTDTGVDFEGWCVDKDGTQDYDFNTKVTDNLTLYAKWAANQCTISFDANGGEEVTTVIVRSFGNTFGTLPETSRTGFIFAGWYKGTTEITATSVVSDVGTLTLKAAWTPLFTLSGSEITGITDEYKSIIGTTGKLEIPEKIDGTAITAFNTTDMAEDTGLTEINLGGVAEVCDDAFSGCTGITKISASPSAMKTTLIQLGTANTVTDLVFLYREGDTTEEWTSNAMDECCAPNVTTVVISDGIETIPTAAFRRCSKLSSVTVPDSITTLGERCFQETAIESISFPESLEAIPDYAFYNCSKLKDINIGSSVSVGAFAFWFCSSLETVSGGEVTYFGTFAFQLCKRLSSIDLSCAENIGSSAFSSCEALQNIELPSIKFLDISCFSYCKGLKTITTGDGNKDFGAYAFSGCAALESAEIAGTATSMGSGVFLDCQETTVISFSDMSGPLPSWTAGWNGPCIVEYHGEE